MNTLIKNHFIKIAFIIFSIVIAININFINDLPRKSFMYGFNFGLIIPAVTIFLVLQIKIFIMKNNETLLSKINKKFFINFISFFFIFALLGGLIEINNFTINFYASIIFITLFVLFYNFYKKYSGINNRMI